MDQQRPVETGQQRSLVDCKEVGQLLGHQSPGGEVERPQVGRLELTVMRALGGLERREDTRVQSGGPGLGLADDDDVHESDSVAGDRAAECMNRLETTGLDRSGGGSNRPSSRRCTLDGPHRGIIDGFFACDRGPPVKPVFVLGMHRSGSSVVTLLLHRLGLDLGAASEQLEATGDNPMGYGELGAVVARNDALLASQGHLWSGPPEMPDEVWSRLGSGPHGQDARVMVEAAFSREEVVIKDPRLCLLLAYWTAALDVQPTLVLALREPSAVARSLRRRDDLPHEHGLLLWERHLRAALAHVSRHGAIVTRYRELIDDPDAGASRLGAQLRDRGFTSVSESRSGIESVVRRELDHSRGDDESEPVLTEPQQRLRDLLSGLPAEVAPGSVNVDDLGPASEGMSVVFASHALARRMATAYETSRRALHDASTRPSELRRLREELDRERERANALTERIAALEDQLTRVRSGLDSATAELAARPTPGDSASRDEERWASERRALLGEIASLRRARGEQILAAIRD